MTYIYLPVTVIIMKILKEEKQTELIVKKSRFIAIARICNSMAEVKKLVDETRALHPNANHVVHCAVIGNEFSFSDDREPKGTAGRPALEVLKGSKISNICVLIVRYFGGTLLGTGGLVKAYGDSVKAVLENIVTEELVDKSDFSFIISYDLYENTKRILESLSAELKNEVFESEITISGQLPTDNLSKLRAQLADLSNGKVIF